MNDFAASFPLIPSLAMLLMGCVPAAIANRNCERLAWMVWWLALANLVAGVAALGWVVAAGRHAVAVSWDAYPLVSIGVLWDGVSSLMFVLVAMVGWVISRFSMRYLEGDADRGNHFRWLGMTLGAVCTMVVSENLLMFWVAWVLTSVGLHHLLLHNGHRLVARRAAWTKFVISRLGDVMLLAAVVLTYQAYGTLRFVEFSDLPIGTSGATGIAIALLLVGGACTKSAQFPFHVWLPETMEAPTPVSALMHAGIINAGGFLLIRTSGLVAEIPLAMMALAIIGGLTACFASLVMLTQTNIKQSLAYSTIAQMGFMMLQCGLGAFSAAMLHILAHSIYKANAFLGSGELAAVVPAGSLANARLSPVASGFALIASLLTAVALYLGCGWVVVTLGGRIGGTWLLSGVLCLALTRWMLARWSTMDPRLIISGIAISAGLCFVYAVCWLAIDNLVWTGVTRPESVLKPGSWAATLTVIVLATTFLALFMLEMLAGSSRQPQWIRNLYVHVSNGFYVEAVARRLLRGAPF